VIVVTQAPTLTPFKDKIKQNLCVLMKTQENILNIKAKTNEGLGAIGNNEAIACYAVASLIKV